MKKSVYNDLSNPNVFDFEEDSTEYQEYLKVLETFSDPSKDDERIGQNIQKLVEYDLYVCKLLQQNRRKLQQCG